MVMKSAVAPRKTATLSSTLDVVGNLAGLIKCETKRQEKIIATRIQSKCKESSLESVIWWKWRAIWSADVKQVFISTFCHSFSCSSWGLPTRYSRRRVSALSQSPDTDSRIKRIKSINSTAQREFGSILFHQAQTKGLFIRERRVTETAGDGKGRTHGMVRLEWWDWRFSSHFNLNSYKHLLLLRYCAI